MRAVNTDSRGAAPRRCSHRELDIELGESRGFFGQEGARFFCGTAFPSRPDHKDGLGKPSHKLRAFSLWDGFPKPSRPQGRLRKAVPQTAFIWSGRLGYSGNSADCRGAARKVQPLMRTWRSIWCVSLGRPRKAVLRELKERPARWDGLPSPSVLHSGRPRKAVLRQNMGRNVACGTKCGMWDGLPSPSMSDSGRPGKAVLRQISGRNGNVGWAS